MVNELNSSNTTFLEYFRKSRLLKVGLIFNIIYYVSILLGYAFFFLNGTLSDTTYTLDFQVFYEAGRMFQISPGDIYSVIPNGLPFRYLPSFAAFMALIVIVPLPSLYVINISIMMIINFGIVYLAYQVSLQVGVTSSTKNFEKTLLFVFIAPQHIINIMFGQITQLAILLVLITLFLLQNTSKDSFTRLILVGLLIGIATTLKPFFFVFIPFLIPVTLLGKYRISASLRHLSGVMLGFVLSMLPNIIYFIEFPSAINGFFEVNFTETLSRHHSTSITRLIVNLLPIFNRFVMEIAIILILGGFIFLRSYLRFIRTPEVQKNYLHHFADMAFLILLVYPDSWFLFLAVLYAFLAPSMLQLYNSSRIPDEETRTLDLLWSGANNLLAFFTFGILLHYLVLGFDPINPIWLLILYIMYHRVFSSNEKEVDP